MEMRGAGGKENDEMMKEKEKERERNRDREREKGEGQREREREIGSFALPLLGPPR